MAHKQMLSSLAFHSRLHAGPSSSLSCTGPACCPQIQHFLVNLEICWKLWQHSTCSWSSPGDLSVHLENSTDPAAMQLQLLLDSFGLVQHVNQPMHTHRGILDVIITSSDCAVSELMVGPPSISDHGPVSCILLFALPGSPVFTSRFVHSWKKLDCWRFDCPSYWVHCVMTTTSMPAWMQMLSSRSMKKLYMIYSIWCCLEISCSHDPISHLRS